MEKKTNEQIEDIKRELFDQSCRIGFEGQRVRTAVNPRHRYAG